MLMAISKSSITFLRQLKKNNHKEWFDANKDAYKKSFAEFTGFIDEMIGRIAEFDSTVKAVEAKDCVFRIYNDVRFAKDKPPYKSHFGAFITSAGKGSAGPGYYIHLEPGGIFAGGGLYMAEGPVMQKIRERIASDPKSLKTIIQSKSFKSAYNGLVQDGALKSAPKGFPKDHPEIELLRLRHYFGTHYFKDDEVMDAKFPASLAKMFKSVHPLNQWLEETMA